MELLKNIKEASPEFINSPKWREFWWSLEFKNYIIRSNAFTTKEARNNNWEKFAKLNIKE